MHTSTAPSTSVRPGPVTRGDKPEGISVNCTRGNAPTTGFPTASVICTSTQPRSPVVTLALSGVMTTTSGSPAATAPVITPPENTTTTHARMTLPMNPNALHQRRRAAAALTVAHIFDGGSTLAGLTEYA